MKAPSWENRSELMRLYVEENWSRQRLAAHLGISEKVLARGLYRLGIRKNREPNLRRIERQWREELTRL